MLRHFNKKSKLRDDNDIRKPHATTTTAARAFFNITLPKMPRAKTKSNLRPESNLEINTRNSWRNCDPNGEEAVSVYLEVRESRFKVTITLH